METFKKNSLGNVLVLGYGVTGRAVVDYLINYANERTSSVTVFCEEGASEGASEGAQPLPLEQLSSSQKIRFVDTLSGFSTDEQFNLCIASPGISQFSELYESAVAISREIVSEVEFAWRESRSDARWVAITGTNGKTTTTALTTHILQGAGFNAHAVGNIGDACITATGVHAQDDKPPIFVAEVSSYQLASTVNFAPNVAVVLNITPDHLSWHKTHENYAAAKWKVLANLQNVADSVAVLDATNEEVRARVRELRQMTHEQRGFDYVPLGTADGIQGDMRARCGAENAAFEDAQHHLCVAFSGEEHDLGAVGDMQIRGPHNVANALAASTCAVALGVSDEQIRKALSSFSPLEHRLEPAGSIAGVMCINDSKATNVDAVLQAIKAYGGAHTIILLGGRDKGTDLTELVDACANMKLVVNFGESRERFVKAFESCAARVVQAKNMEDALDRALVSAKAGDTIVLSPACASFDEFSCFEQRGEVFKQLVAERAKV